MGLGNYICTTSFIFQVINTESFVWLFFKQIPEVATTCNLEAVMDGYYKFLFPLNPGNIRPIIPGSCENEVLLKPHNRELLSMAEGVQVYVT